MISWKTQIRFACKQHLDITLDEKLGLGFSQIGLDMDYTENKEAQKSSVDMTYALDAQNMALSMIFC